MATIDFSLTLRSDGWTIGFEGCGYGRYPTLKKAMDVSIRLAEEQRKNGAVARVLVEDDDGRLQIEWTSQQGFCGSIAV